MVNICTSIIIGGDSDVHMCVYCFFSGTFFVEYHFPAPVGRAGKWRETGSRKRLFPPPHEVVRVASRKIKDKGS